MFVCLFVCFFYSVVAKYLKMPSSWQTTSNAITTSKYEHAIQPRNKQYSRKQVKGCEVVHFTNATPRRSYYVAANVASGTLNSSAGTVAQDFLVHEIPLSSMGSIVVYADDTKDATINDSLEINQGNYVPRVFILPDASDALGLSITFVFIDGNGSQSAMGDVVFATAQSMQNPSGSNDYLNSDHFFFTITNAPSKSALIPTFGHSVASSAIPKTLSGHIYPAGSPDIDMHRVIITSPDVGTRLTFRAINANLWFVEGIVVGPKSI
jgi:hypothetical protein